MAKRILIVDDDENMVEMARIGLEQAGYEVAGAFDGEQGLAAAKKNKPDLMLLDLNMPRMHGYQVCEMMRNDAALKDIKIVVISAKRYTVDMNQAKALGADAYIVKPYSFDELLSKVKGLLGP